MNDDNNSSNNIDDWTIVKTKKKVHKGNNKHININNKNNKKPIKLNRIIDDDDDDVNTYDNVIKVINATTIELKRSKYYIKLIESIRSSITSKSSNTSNCDDTNYVLKEIVSLGIGAFSKSPSALLQLVMTLCLAQEFLHDTNTDNKCDDQHMIKYNCIVFDPIFNDIEVLVCNKLGLAVSKENKYGKHMTTTNDDDKKSITMFFMPHCPYRLYCNLLWKNWSNLANIIIYGNSFSSYGLRRMNNSSKDIDLTDCIVCMESFIVEKPYR